MSDQLPLTPAQQQTARELPWYREWLMAICEHPALRYDEAGNAYCVRCPWWRSSVESGP